MTFVKNWTLLKGLLFGVFSVIKNVEHGIDKPPGIFCSPVSKYAPGAWLGGVQPTHFLMWGDIDLTFCYTIFPTKKSFLF